MRYCHCHCGLSNIYFFKIGFGEAEGRIYDDEVPPPEGCSQKFKEVVSEWSSGNLQTRFVGGESPLDVIGPQLRDLSFYR